MNIIEIKDCSHHYDSGFCALKNININIKEGSFFGLLGPNGAGKTTLISLLSSLLMVQEGDITAFGKSLHQERLEVKQALGLVPQELNLNFHLPVWHILVNQGGYFGVPRAEAKRRANHWLSALGLAEHRHKMVKQLSGGMKRRVMIARALMHHPKLLLLDEPTAGVDVELKHLTWDILRELNANGTTIVLTTHNLEEAENLCEDLAIINHGNLVMQDSMQTIMNRLSGECFRLQIEGCMPEAFAVSGFKINVIAEDVFELWCNKEQNLHDVFDACHALGIRIKRVWKPTSRLEEVFLHVLRENA